MAGGPSQARHVERRARPARPRFASRESIGAAQRPMDRVSRSSSERSVSDRLPLRGGRRSGRSNRGLSLNAKEGALLPKNRPPTAPGEGLLHEFLRPKGMTQVELAGK